MEKMKPERAAEAKEMERQAADLANSAHKSERFHAQNDLRAFVLQQKWEHCGGGNYQ
jgi:hypothetical protein